MEQRGSAIKGRRRLTAAAGRYAVFTHGGHITTILAAMRAIWNDLLPRSGHRVGDVPEFFERYDARFDPRTGTGGFEIWVPLKG